MDKYIVVFCEGDHDVAFLSRILLVNGFSPYDKKIKDFIKPLNKLYIETLKDKKIEDSKFKFQQPNIKIPYAVFKKEKTLIIFHNLGGDGNILNGKVDEIFNTYLEQNDEILQVIGGYEKLNYRFLYFLDADNEGVTSRLESLKETLSLENLSHYEIVKKDDYEIGCCIFYDKTESNRYGKLEDIILNLMYPKNRTIFDESSSFIKNSMLNSNRQREFICTNKKEETKGSIQFKKEKSIISVAGQLQFSGASNSVIIAKSDYIKKGDIDNSLICQNIIKLFL